MRSLGIFNCPMCSLLLRYPMGNCPLRNAPQADTKPGVRLRILPVRFPSWYGVGRTPWQTPVSHGHTFRWPRSFPTRTAVSVHPLTGITL